VKELDVIELIKSVGNRIRDTRILKGLAQATLSYDANIPENQVGRIERGEISTSIITLFKICKSLNIQIQVLYI
jgi:DNA-binding XRE family transcriptional regulator